GCRIYRTGRLIRDEIEPEVGYARLVQGCRRKRVIPRRGVLIGLLRIGATKARKGRSRKWHGIVKRRILIQAVEPDRVVVGDLSIKAAQKLILLFTLNRIEYEEVVPRIG